MFPSRCFIAAGCAIVLGVIGTDRSHAGMMHPSSHDSGQPHPSSRGNHGASSGKQSKPPKQPKSKNNKQKKGNGPGTTGTGTGGTDDSPTIPDPPLDVVPQGILPMPGEETYNGDFGYGSDLGILPGYDAGNGLPSPFAVTPDGIVDQPPVQLPDLNTPDVFSTFVPVEDTVPMLTDVDRPRHNPEPSGFVLAAIGGASVITVRVRRNRCRQSELA